MKYVVYTREHVRAIVEETKLNAEDNPSLYDAVCEARMILKDPNSESVTPDVIQDLEEELGRYKNSYAAAHRRKELFIVEAERIVRAQDIFKLDRVAHLIQHLDEYKTPEALEYKQALHDLRGIVQDAKGYVSGLREFPQLKVKWLLDELKPYAPQSAEISGIQQKLKEHYALFAH